jgi:hypothetical protein
MGVSMRGCRLRQNREFFSKLGMLIIPFVLSGIAIAAQLEINGLDTLEKESTYGSHRSEVVAVPSSQGPKFLLGHGKTVESELCNIDTLAHIYLYKDAGRLTAGFASVGLSGDIEYIEIGNESQFLYLPEHYYNQIVEAVGKLGTPTYHKKMMVIPASQMEKLPMMHLQFSLSNIQYNLNPAAYTRCETIGESSARRCVLLVKKNENNTWVVGRPFLDHVVYTMSFGSEPNPIMRICLPPAPLSASVTGFAVETYRRLPYTRQQYMMGIAIGLFALLLIWWFWGDVICKCCRKRTASTRPAPVPVVAVGRVSNKSTPKPSSDEDKQPLINKV